MIVLYDYNGTLVNSKEIIFQCDAQVRRNLDYPLIEPGVYFSAYQSNWRQMYADLGIRPEAIDRYIQEFKSVYSSARAPRWVPGAVPLLKAMGRHSFGLLTDSPLEAVAPRLITFGLEFLLGNVDTSHGDKANGLYHAASEHTDDTVIYVADTVSDGLAVLRARQMGAKNLHYCAMRNQYAFSPASQMVQFFNDHQHASWLMSHRDLRVLKQDLRITVSIGHIYKDGFVSAAMPD